MQKNTALMFLVLFAGLCFAADDRKSLVKGVKGNKAIGIAPIRAIDHVGSNRYALIIGINDYQDPMISDLETCESDAKAVYALLTHPQKGGVSKENAYLLLGREATTKSIKKHLGRFRQIPSNSTVFVYFSGHGTKDDLGDAYWVTWDSEIDSMAASGFPDREIKQFLSRIPSDRVVVMLDCCYAAATVKEGSNSKALSKDFNSILQPFTGKGRAYLMAAGSGEEAIEARDLKRSVFTYYLVEGLAGRADYNRDGVIVLTELSTYIDSNVGEEARRRSGTQRPVVHMNVSEPSMFALTIDPDRKRKVDKRQADDLDFLRKLYLDDKISVGCYNLGQRLIEESNNSLTKADIRRKQEFRLLIDGKLPPGKLIKALDAISDFPSKITYVPPSIPEPKIRVRESVDSIIDTKMNKTLSTANSVLEQMKALLNE